MENEDFYPNTIDPKPEHGAQGQHREFIGKWSDGLQYSGDRLGSDIYCAECNHWNTVKGTSILYSVIGDCKNCGASFLHKKNKQ